MTRVHQGADGGEEWRQTRDPSPTRQVPTSDPTPHTPPLPPASPGAVASELRWGWGGWTGGREGGRVGRPGVRAWWALFAFEKKRENVFEKERGRRPRGGEKGERGVEGR